MMAKRPGTGKKGKEPDRKGAMGEVQGEFVLKVPDREPPPIPIVRLSDEDCVARGAAFLDVLRPGWEARIPSRMAPDGTRSILVDVQSVQGCPLACAFGRSGWPDYAEGVRRVCRPDPYTEKSSGLSPSSPSRQPRPQYRGSDTSQLAAYGFAPHRDHAAPDPYRVLNALWMAEILRRLEVPLP